MHAAALTALLATASSAFAQFQTFQGRLDDAGAPATGIYDFLVEHFAGPSGGTTVGLTNEFVDVPVQNGLFSLTYDAAPGTFDGSERWVRISVRPGASTGAFTPLPRQRVTATPYAIRSLNERWTPAGSVLRTDAGITSLFINTASTPFADAAITMRGSGSQFSGMYSDVESTTGVSYYGWAVAGISRLEARYLGAANRFTLGNLATAFINIESDGRIGIGGVASGSARLQVTGDARVSATATASDFAYITPSTRSFTLPPAAFTGNSSIAPAVGNDRIYFGTITATARAPVHLPDGATVTAVHLVVVDNAAGDITATLWRNTFTGSTLSMASAVSSGAVAGSRTITDTSINSPLIDNTTGAYAVFISSTGWDVNANFVRAVRIEYTVPGPD